MLFWVEYFLIDYGWFLKSIFDLLCFWGEYYIEKMYFDKEVVFM